MQVVFTFKGNTYQCMCKIYYIAPAALRGEFESLISKDKLLSVDSFNMKPTKLILSESSVGTLKA